MPSLPPRTERPPDMAQLDGNKDNAGYDDEINDGPDGGALTHEEKIAMQEAIMINDLSSCIRDKITSSDFTRRPHIPLSQLQRNRAVNDQGSEAYKAFIANKKVINRWNNLHAELKNDGGVEDLDSMMDGQSHRHRLTEVVSNTGGQKYDPKGSDDVVLEPTRVHSTRGGSTTNRGGRGGGIIGTRGRGPPTSSGPPTTRSGVAYRPLDPAVEQGTNYGLGKKRDVQRGRGARQENQSPARGSGSSGKVLARGGRGHDVRGNMVGTTVRVAATSARPPPVKQPVSHWAPSTLAVNPSPQKIPDPMKPPPPTSVAAPPRRVPPPPKKVPPVKQDSVSYEMLLNPAAFLAAISSTMDRQAFDKMIPSQPKPAPASKAAEVIAKPSKKIEKDFKDVVQSTPKPALPVNAVQSVANLNLLKETTQRAMMEPNSRESKSKEPSQSKPALICKTDGMKAMVRTTVESQLAEQPKIEGLTIKETNIGSTIRTKPKIERPMVKIPEVTNLILEEEEEQRRVLRKGTKEVPTHEVAFPPPLSKSLKLIDRIDAWTDGVPSPGTSTFSSSTEHSPAVWSANVAEGKIGGEMTQPSSATVGTATPVASPGTGVSTITVPAPGPQGEGNLVSLGPEEVIDQGGVAPRVPNFQAAGAAADLMDLVFNDVPEDSSTLAVPEEEPKPNHVPQATSDEHPVCVVINGTRYIRADQFQRFTQPEGVTGSILKPSLAPTPALRIVTEKGYSIGAQNLGPHNDTILGEKNLARKPQELSAPSNLSSIWENRQTGGARGFLPKSESSVGVEPEPLLEDLLQSHQPLDLRPAAIGEQNLPGRSKQDAARDNQIGSPWNEPKERVLQPMSQNIADGQVATRMVDSSSETRPSTELENELLGQPQASSSSEPRTRSSTSGDIPTAGAVNSNVIIPLAETDQEQLVRLTNSRGSAGMTPFNAGHSSAVIPRAETDDERLVRLTNSHGSAGMTPFNAEHSRDSSHSESTAGILNRNLTSSRWAVEDGSTSSMRKKYGRGGRGRGRGRGS